MELQEGRRSREFCSPQPHLGGCGRSRSAHPEELKGDPRAPLLITTLLRLPIVLSGLSGACQDIIRPLELNWKNVGELCNYNHNLCSRLQHCGAKAKQGEGKSKGKVGQKGALFTSNRVSSTTSLGLKQEKPVKQSHLLL